MGLTAHPFSFPFVEANHIPVQCSRAIIADEAKRGRLRFRLVFWISTPHIELSIILDWDSNSIRLKHLYRDAENQIFNQTHTAD